MKPRENHIKVNLPKTYEDYLSGNGEGCWVLVDDTTKKAHDEDATGGIWLGTLDNDSCYYAGINHGAEIAFEMRGNNRPVVTWDWIENLKTCPVCGTVVKEQWDCNSQRPYFCPCCDEFRSVKEVYQSIVSKLTEFTYDDETFWVETKPMPGYDALGNYIPDGVVVVGLFKEKCPINLTEGRWRPADDFYDAIDVALEMLNDR